MKLESVLFDLDGTLLDTAPDLVTALNILRHEEHKRPLSVSEIKPFISLGSKAMVRFALTLDEDHPDFMRKRAQFLQLYEQNIARETRLFAGIDAVIAHLEARQMPWGIVTNKLTAQTELLLLHITDLAPHCLVCGDTLDTCKPDPAPLLHACALLQVDPSNCLYVGDAVTDIMAAQAAGAKSMAAVYGYIAAEEDPLTWQADHYATHPQQILELCQRW